MEMDYISVEPLYVIEGYVSDSEIEVAVSRTMDMEDEDSNTPAGNVVVEISGTDGLSEVLQHEGAGIYRSRNGSKGKPGNTYMMTVNAAGREFVATSEMEEPGKLAPVVFARVPHITERYVFCTVGIVDPADTDNYYCIRILKNGENFSRTLMTDKGHDGGIVDNTILVRFSWNEEPTPQEIADGNDDKMFRKGDEFEMILETVDRAVYDYLYSLDLSVGSLSNPLSNISGGALGYFRAFSPDGYSMIFDPEEIPEIDDM